MALARNEPRFLILLFSEMGIVFEAKAAVPLAVYAK
jgi:hypothetical protein